MSLELEKAKDCADRLFKLFLAKNAGGLVKRLRAKANEIDIPFDIDDKAVDWLEKEIGEFTKEELGLQ